RLADVAGVMGTLLELVEVEDGFQAAFEAAAGPVLAAVVVDGVDAARRGLHEFQRGSVPGGVITVPEPGVGARSLAAWPKEEAASSGPGGPEAGWTAEGSAGPAADRALPPGATVLRHRVRARLPSVAALMDGLLAGAVVVEGDWKAAADLAIACPDL